MISYVQTLIWHFLTGKLTTWGWQAIPSFNVSVPIIQYLYNSIVSDRFMAWHPMTCAQMASVMKTSSDCSCQEINYSWHDVMYMVYTRMYNMINVCTWYVHIKVLYILYYTQYSLYKYMYILISPESQQDFVVSTVIKNSVLSLHSPLPRRASQGW